MIKILLVGCSGKMGMAITKLVENGTAFSIAAGVSKEPVDDCIYPVFNSIAECNVAADVIIDFSRPETVLADIEYSAHNRTPLMVGTSALTEKHLEALKVLATHVPVLHAANTSLGFNLLLDLVQHATKSLQETFDIEIIESHHSAKVDAPSGGAFMIANAINSALDQPKDYIYDRHSIHEKRNKNHIGIQAIRGGNIVGDHTAIFAGMDEVLKISHHAQSKDIFAKGALECAKFLMNVEPGMYGMKDVLNKKGLGS